MRKGMHVLVTGGAGFIGAHSVRELLAGGHRVTALDDLSRGSRGALPPEAALQVLDVRSPELGPLLQQIQPEAVLHLAAQMDVRRSMADPVGDASTNVLGTVGALQAAAACGARRFVFASSAGAVYGEQDHFPAREGHPRRPVSAYGTSKLCGEEYLAFYRRAFGLSTLSLRYANVYGPGQDPAGEAGVVAIFCERLLAGEKPVVNGDGLQTRDYVHVSDVARVNALALQSDVSGALNVGTGRETSVLQLLEILAGPGSPVLHGSPWAGEQRRSAVDPAAAKAALGWAPQIRLEEGAPDTLRWFRRARGQGPGSTL
jgi:UDP-glucose 4-epimerase